MKSMTHEVRYAGLRRHYQRLAEFAAMLMPPSLPEEMAFRLEKEAAHAEKPWTPIVVTRDEAEVFDEIGFWHAVRKAPFDSLTSKVFYSVRLGGASWMGHPIEVEK